MFVRVRKQPGKEGPIPYAYLVQNCWNPFRKKHEQKILMALGRLSDLPADGTVEKIIHILKKKYQIGRVILIADRGMVSEDNLRVLEKEKLSYLLGVRMRKLSPLYTLVR